MHIIYMLLQIYENWRLQSLLEANKRGSTLRYDPPASRNLCFYHCPSKFVDVKEEDIVQMVQRHLLCNQIVTCANKVWSPEIQASFLRFLSQKLKVLLRRRRDANIPGKPTSLLAEPGYLHDKKLQYSANQVKVTSKW